MTQHLLSCLLVSFLILGLSTCPWWLTSTQESDLVTGFCPSSPGPLAEYESCDSKFLPCWLLNPSSDIFLFFCFFQDWCPTCWASSYSLRGLTCPSGPYLTWTEQSDLAHCSLSSTSAGALPRAWSCFEPVSAYVECHYTWLVPNAVWFWRKYLWISLICWLGHICHLFGCMDHLRIPRSPPQGPAGHAEKAT